MLAVSILLCGLVAPATAQVVLYDDFSGNLIDPTRWRPNVSGAGIMSTRCYAKCGG